MLKDYISLNLLALLLLTSCATTKLSPVPVECPLPPKPPAALIESASHEANLTKRFNDSLQTFKDSLQKAIMP